MMPKEAFFLPVQPFPVGFRITVGVDEYVLRTQFREIISTYDESLPEGRLETGTHPITDLRVVEGSPTFLVSSTFTGYTGAAGDGSGMRDSVDDDPASVWGTAGVTGGTITADLGEVKDSVERVELRPIPQTFDNWGAANLNGSTLETSVDGATWTSKGTIAGCMEETYRAFSVREVCRYIRLSNPGWLAVADFRVFLEELIIQPPLNPDTSDMHQGLMSTWVLSIGDHDDVPLIMGVPLTTGLDLVWQYPDLELGFNLVVQCRDRRTTPTYDSLGVRDSLILVREKPTYGFQSLISQTVTALPVPPPPMAVPFSRSLAGLPKRPVYPLVRVPPL
jgi:hypothetical protein